MDEAGIKSVKWINKKKTPMIPMRSVRHRTQKNKGRKAKTEEKAKEKR